jgi:hypothetical protein
MRGLHFKGYQPALSNQGSDIVGIPYLDEETKTMRYALPSWLPKEGDPEVEDGRGGIIFIDEVNRAPQEVMQGLFEPLGEGEISLAGWKLPPGWSFVCAANPNETGYKVNEMDVAFLNRLINYAPGWSETEWVNWALKNGKIPAKVIDFVLQVPNRVERGEARLPGDVNPAATPRSLTYLGALYEEGMPLRMLHTLGMGLIGEDAIEEFIRIHLEGEEIQPLSGPEILRGRSEAGEDVIVVMKDWYETKRNDLIRGSTTYAIATLYEHRDKIGDNNATRAFYRWFMNLPEYFIGETIAHMQESLPELLDYYKQDAAFARRVPPAALINKPDATRLDKELSEQRKVTEYEQWKKEVGSNDDDFDDDDDILAGL